MIKNRRKLSNRRLKNEKYNLIKQIKENYGKRRFLIQEFQTIKYLIISLYFI